MRPQQATLPTNEDSDLAVQAYIESLLIDSATTVESTASAASSDPALNADKLVADIPIVNEKAAATCNDLDSVDPDRIELDSDASSVDIPHNNPFLKQLEAAQRRGRSKVGAVTDAVKVDNRPAWGRQGFRCLAFNVSGLKLAVPVHFIDGMQPLDLLPSSVQAAAPANSVVQGALVLGQIKVNHGDDESQSFAVLDTARLVMPERYDNAMKESYRYVLTLKNCDWSIAVDSIGGEIALSPQNVRWRSEHTRREWLAGTVVDKMCALIDIDLLNRQMMADAILMGDDGEGT